MPTDRRPPDTVSESLYRCDHEGCRAKTHCILDALWINPGEFANPEPIYAAAVLQERFWEQRRAYKVREHAVVESLWMLVEAGGANV